MSHGRFQSPYIERQRAPRAIVSTARQDCPHTPEVFGRIGPSTPVTAADWHERGVEHELADDLPAAIRCYTRAIAVGGPDTQTLFDLAYALAESGDRCRALLRYREVVRLDPERADAWVNLGELLAEDEHTDTAVECFRHAIDLDPTDATAYYNLADLLDREGDVAAAQSSWATFIRLANDHPRQVAYAELRLREATA